MDRDSEEELDEIDDDSDSRLCPKLCPKKQMIQMVVMLTDSVLIY